MRSHVIEVGPTSIRRLCCGGGIVVDVEARRAAFESVDDPVTLINRRPISVVSLWENILATIDCGTSAEVTVIHPSWWSPARVQVLSSAALALIGVAEMRPRSWLLARAAPSTSENAALFVEIADDFVVVTGAEVMAESRRRDDGAVAGAVVASIQALASEASGTVVVDAPATVRNAATLASTIAKVLPGFCGMDVVVVDDLCSRRLAGELKSSAHPQEALDAPTRWMRCRRPLASVVLAVGVIVSGVALHGHDELRADGHPPTRFAVEGHVAVEVPAQWPMQRVVAGPGSARMQITSPADPEVALHVTQSRVASPNLDATAEFLKSAIDAAPAGVFVDFNPADRRAGRPAATYREVRAGHDIRWTVWVDKAVRISIGCQSRSGRDDAVSQQCDLAVRSARALD